MKKTLTGLVLGACLVMTPADSDAQRRRFDNLSPPPASSVSQKQTAPIIQIYDSKIEIDEIKKKRFKNYLEERLRISTQLSEHLLNQYRAGIINFESIMLDLSRETIYKSAIEAFESGDENIYDMIFKNTAYRNNILVGLKGKVLKNNLDDKYNFAETILKVVEAKFRAGATTRVDLLRAEGTVADLKFLYDMYGIPIQVPVSKER